MIQHGVCGPPGPSKVAFGVPDELHLIEKGGLLAKGVLKVPPLSLVVVTGPAFLSLDSFEGLSRLDQIRQVDVVSRGNGMFLHFAEGVERVVRGLSVLEKRALRPVLLLGLAVYPPQLATTGRLGGDEVPTIVASRVFLRNIDRPGTIVKAVPAGSRFACWLNRAN